MIFNRAIRLLSVGIEGCRVDGLLPKIIALANVELHLSDAYRCEYKHFWRQDFTHFSDNYDWRWWSRQQWLDKTQLNYFVNLGPVDVYQLHVYGVTQTMDELTD